MENQSQAYEDLQQKLLILQNLNSKLSKRNEYIKQNYNFEEISSLSTNQSIQFPNSSDIERLAQSRKRCFIAKTKNQKLKLANKALDNRIKTANTKLQQQQEQYNNDAIAMLSPTAARYLGIKQNQSEQKVIQQRIVETTMLEKQLEAIMDLKNGAKPRAYLKNDIKLDPYINEAKNELNNINESNAVLSQHLKEVVKNYLSKDNYHVSLSLQKRATESFNEFLQSYHRASNTINEKPLKSLLIKLKQKVQEEDENKYQAIIKSLDSERQMILKQLAFYGNDDEELSSLKEEIDFQLLYLSHLTAVAGKALSKMSTIQEPIDPIENIEADIAEMKHRLNK